MNTIKGFIQNKILSLFVIILCCKNYQSFKLWVCYEKNFWLGFLVLFFLFCTIKLWFKLHNKILLTELSSWLVKLWKVWIKLLKGYENGKKFSSYTQLEEKKFLYIFITLKMNWEYVDYSKALTLRSKSSIQLALLRWLNHQNPKKSFLLLHPNYVSRLSKPRRFQGFK